SANQIFRLAEELLDFHGFIPTDPNITRTLRARPICLLDPFRSLLKGFRRLFRIPKLVLGHGNEDPIPGAPRERLRGLIQIGDCCFVVACSVICRATEAWVTWCRTDTEFCHPKYGRGLVRICRRDNARIREMTCYRLRIDITTLHNVAKIL